MNTEKIGKFIAESRKRKKITQAQLGECLGVTDKAVSKWECGKCLPDSSLFEGLCQTLEISMNELIRGECIEMQNVERANKEIFISLLKEIQKYRKNQTLTGAFCALLISFSIMLFLSIWEVGLKTYEQFMFGALQSIGLGCLLIGCVLIFYTWVKSVKQNT